MFKPLSDEADSLVLALVKVKQPHYRPGQAWGFQEIEAHEGGKVVSPTHAGLLEAKSTPGP
jgi:hypothetical protein